MYGERLKWKSDIWDIWMVVTWPFELSIFPLCIDLSVWPLFKGHLTLRGPYICDHLCFTVTMVSYLVQIWLQPFPFSEVRPFLMWFENLQNVNTHLINFFFPGFVTQLAGHSNRLCDTWHNMTPLEAEELHCLNSKFVAANPLFCSPAEVGWAVLCGSRSRR